jgi:hypothetical protein
MKLLLGFFMGTTVALLVVLLVFHNTAPVMANRGSPITTTQIVTTTVAVNGNFSTVSDTTTDTGSLLPDVKAIDENALGAPYRQVESEITDPDIAAYFHTLMTETGLDKAGLSH